VQAGIAQVLDHVGDAGGHPQRRSFFRRAREEQGMLLQTADRAGQFVVGHPRRLLPDLGYGHLGAEPCRRDQNVEPELVESGDRIPHGIGARQNAGDRSEIRTRGRGRGGLGAVAQHGSQVLFSEGAQRVRQPDRGGVCHRGSHVKGVAGGSDRFPGLRRIGPRKFRALGPAPDQRRRAAATATPAAPTRAVVMLKIIVRVCAMSSARNPASSPASR
jgi:hypothetical protein